MMFVWLVNLLRSGLSKAKPIRVIERQWDGCMANSLTREDKGTVIDFDMRLLIGWSDRTKVEYWLIRWDGDREDSWYPAMFFRRTETGELVRDC